MFTEPYAPATPSPAFFAKARQAVVSTTRAFVDSVRITFCIHDAIPERSNGVIRLRCTKCRATSPGVDIGAPRFRVRQEGDPARHRLARPDDVDVLVMV